MEKYLGLVGYFSFIFKYSAMQDIVSEKIC